MSLTYMASGSWVREPTRKATVGDVGETIRSKRRKAVSKSSLTRRAHLLRLAVVGVVVAGRERVRADHDAPLDLRAETLAARALVHLDEVFGAVGAVAVAHAVEARQVRAGLGRRDDVVRRQGVLGVRQAASPRTCRRAPRSSRTVSSKRARTPGSTPSARYSTGTPKRSPSSRSCRRHRRPRTAAGRWWSRTRRTRRCGAAAGPQSATERVSGPIWSRELAKATSP